MAYSEALADRIRQRLSLLDNVEEKKMMGGLVFMYNNKMCVGVVKEDMMCRIDKAFHNQAIEMNGCSTMDFSNRPMIGYVIIDETVIRSHKDFEYWIGLALDYNKHAKRSKRRK